MFKNIQEAILVLIIFAIIALFGNWVGFQVMPLSVLPGMIILVLICIAGMIVKELIPVNIPSVAYIAIIGIIVSMPWTPGSEYVVQATADINLLALATPILAYAGVAIGRNWVDFRQLGWKSVLVALLVLFGTFIGSAIVAHLVLKIQGIIP